MQVLAWALAFVNLLKRPPQTSKLSTSHRVDLMGIQRHGEASSSETAAAVIFYCICSGSMLLVRSTHTEKSAVSILLLCAIYTLTRFNVLSRR